MQHEEKQSTRRYDMVAQFEEIRDRTTGGDGIGLRRN
jgi:hypothetical protein